MNAEVASLLENAEDVFARADQKEVVELSRDLLQTAQCGSAMDARKVVRLLVKELAFPHAAITDGLMQLLQLFPRQVIPYVADLIGEDEDSTEIALATYSELLQEDRSLLTEIVASAADLQLDDDQRTNLRDTLVYAFGTVDEDDVPAIAHALLRSGVSEENFSVIREKSRSLSDGTAALVADVLADSIRMTCRGSQILLNVCGQCQNGVSSLDLITWATALSRPRDRIAAIASVKRAAAGRGITANGLSTVLDVHPTMLERHADRLRKLANLLLRLHKPEEVTSAVVRTLFLGILKTCSRARRSLATDLASSLCSSNPAIARRAADVVNAVAITGSNFMESWVHLLLEPLQRASALNPVIVTTLSESAGMLVGGRRQLATSMLVSIRKQLLFGKTVDKCTAALLCAAIIPRLDHADAVDALDLLIRANPAPEADETFSKCFLEAVADLLLKGVRIDLSQIKTISKELVDIIATTDDLLVHVRIDRLLDECKRSMIISVATAATNALMVQTLTPKAPLSFLLDFSEVTSEYLNTGEVPSDRKEYVADELRLASNFVIGLANIYSKSAQGKEFVEKLSMAYEYRLLARELADTSRLVQDEQIHGAAAAIALRSMSDQDERVELLSHLLQCVSLLGEEEEAAYQTARLPRLVSFLKHLVLEENKFRVRSNEEKQKGHTELDAKYQKLSQVCREGLAAGLRLAVLEKAAAERLSETIIASTCDSGLAATSIDLAMKSGISDSVAAKLWLKSLSRIFELGDRSSLPELPSALHFSTVSDPLFSDTRRYGSISYKANLHSDGSLRYRLVSFFACMDGERRVDEACGWVRECSLGSKSKYPEVASTFLAGAMSILATVTHAAMRSDIIPNAERAAKRVSLLRGILKLGSAISVANAALKIPKCFTAVMGKEGDAACIEGLKLLSMELAMVAEEMKRSKLKNDSQRAPRIALAVDVIEDFINFVEESYDLDPEATPMPAADEDRSNVVSGVPPPKPKKRKRSSKEPSSGFEVKTAAPTATAKSFSEDHIRVRFH